MFSHGAGTDLGIPYYTNGVYGAGLAIQIGPVTERFRLYVFYRDLERAGEIVEGLFDAPVESDGSDGDPI